MFFGPNLGTRNAKNPFEPFKVPKCNQKTAKLKKKLMSFNSLASGWFWRFSQKNSSFGVPYQHPSSSADCARELFNGSNGSASL